MNTMPKPGTPAFRANLSRLYEKRLIHALKAAAKDCGKLHHAAGAPALPAVTHRHDGDGRLVVEVSLLLPPVDGDGWLDN